MYLKRSISLLICVMLVVSLFAACGKAEQPKSEATTGQTQSAVPETTVVEKGPPIHLVFEKPIWGDKPADDPTNQLVREKLKEILNIDVETVGQQNPANQEEKAKMMLASGEQLDLFNVADWMPYRKDGVIIPINDLLDKYGQDILKNAIPESMRIRTDSDGKIWAVPYEQYPVSTCVVMRKDWLDELGLKVPATIEEFENVMQAFKEKKNDEGFVQQWQGGLENAFAGSFIKTGDQNWLDTDGKLKPYYLSPQYKDFLAKMQEWYKKGYIHKEVATMQFQQAYDTIYGGRSSCTYTWLNSLQYQNDLGRPKVPGFNLAGVPPLKGSQPGLIAKSLPAGWAYIITKSSKNPEAAMKFMNFVGATDEGYLLSTFGLEGKHWVWADKEKGLVKLPDGIKNEDKFNGVDSVITAGVLVHFQKKFTMNLGDLDFMNWLNDDTKVNSSFPVDSGVVYDASKYKSKDIVASLDTLRITAEYKIIMGQKPASYWDDVIKEWLKKGGSTYIDDITEQYNAAKK